MRRLIVAGAVALCLSGCAHQPPPVQQVFIRTDGQRIAGVPANQSQFEIDKTICEGEVQRANMSGVQVCRGIVDCAVASNARAQSAKSVALGCMAQRGYVLVLETEVDARRAQFLAAQQPTKGKR